MSRTFAEIRRAAVARCVGMEKYSEDQPRDDSGRWSPAGGGGSARPADDKARMREHGVPAHDMRGLEGIPAAAAIKVYEAERDIRHKPEEHAVVVSKTSGETLLAKRGAYDHVTFTKDEIDGMTAKEAVFSHNHPSGSAFSMEDVMLASRVLAREMRAVSKDGTVYRIRPAKIAWPDGERVREVWTKWREKATEVVFPVLNARVKAWQKLGDAAVNGLPALEADNMHTHWVAENAAKELGLKYERVLGKGVKREVFRAAA